MNNLKRAFERVKEDILQLSNEISELRLELSEIKNLLNIIDQDINSLKIQQIAQGTAQELLIPSQKLLVSTQEQENQTQKQGIPTDFNTSTYVSTDNLPSEALKQQDTDVSIGNQGASTDRQTDRQTDTSTDFFKKFFFKNVFFPHENIGFEVKKQQKTAKNHKNEQKIVKNSQKTSKYQPNYAILSKKTSKNDEKSPFLAQNSVFSQNLTNFEENHNFQKLDKKPDTKLDKIDKKEKATQILDGLDNLKKELRITFKKLTNQEMLVFSAVYQLEEEGQIPDYSSLAQKLGLSESSIRDYINRIISKGVPVDKTKINNKKITLSIPENIKKIASLNTIISLREL